jgi:hypothetical protein
LLRNIGRDLWNQDNIENGCIRFPVIGNLTPYTLHPGIHQSCLPFVSAFAYCSFFCLLFVLLLFALSFFYLKGTWPFLLSHTSPAQVKRDTNQGQISRLASPTLMGINQ